MLKQDMKFTDYNGNERTITEYFHLNEAEIVDMQAKSVNGIQEDMQNAILSNDAGRVLDFIKMLVHKSYGKKSIDGINFDKSDEILNKFVTSAYYSDFLLGLIEDNGAKGQLFVQGIMPAKLVERALAQVQGQEGGEVDRTVYGASAREQFAAAQAAKTEGAVDVASLYPTSLGTPDYPQFAPNNTPTLNQSTLNIRQNPETGQPSSEEFEKFQQWRAQQEAAKQAAASASAVEFRVREEEPQQPMQGLARPPHEQIGDAQ